MDAETERKKAGLAELAARIGETEKNIQGFTADIEGFAEPRARERRGDPAQRGEVQELDAAIEDLRVQLRAITEDIVTQLDARLKEMGYSSAERRSVEQSIAETLQSLRIQLGGKVTLLEDASQVQNTPAAAREKIVQSTLAVLKASLERLTALEKLFERYRTFAPSFLDEFLAPEGIITRKRDIDERVNENAAGIARLRQRNEELARENVGPAGEDRGVPQDPGRPAGEPRAPADAADRAGSRKSARLARERTRAGVAAARRRGADHGDPRPGDGDPGEDRRGGKGAAGDRGAGEDRPLRALRAWKGRSPAATRSSAPRKRS